LNKRTKL